MDILLDNMIVRSKTFVKQMIYKWLGKLNSLFFEFIWKNRCNDMQEWEKLHNIFKKDKKKKKYNRRDRKFKDSSNDVKSGSSGDSSKSTIRECNKRVTSGKKKNSVHYVDEELYIKIRSFIFGSNFQLDMSI